jgi:phenylalanyl-tRNA synthetase beta chain
MKISVAWLREMVEIPESPEELREPLSRLGLVVESLTRYGDDSVLEIEVTSNRPDCMSHLGIARELSAFYRRPLEKPPAAGRLRLSREEIPYTIEIKDPALCPRYTGLVMDGIHVAPSPGWMQRRLEAAGMRPLNNIVDITNYVLLELGHPLHAFDFQRLGGGKIVVARAQPGQKLTTLDGVERELDHEMLMINDARGPVAIGGVMGGLDSEITERTRTVLLECAYFHPASIRRTAKKLGLATEASYRFERGADWDDTISAIARTSRLIQEIAGGHVAGSLRDIYPRKLKPARLRLRRSRAEALLGVKLKDSFITSTLKRLGFESAGASAGVWRVTCPTYRADMELEADLIEEVARFYGYDNIPATFPGSRTSGLPSPVSRVESAARGILLGLGYSESVNLSFAGQSEHVEFGDAGGGRVFIKNPLTEETGFLRATLASGLVRTAKRNFNHEQRDLRLFEIGKVYRLDSNGRPGERDTLGILGTGDFAGHNWHHPGGNYDFFHLKGVISALLRGMRSLPWEMVPAPEVPWLNPANAATLVIEGARVGCAGSLHPALEEQYKLKQPVFLAEIDFEQVARSVFTPVQYQILARYPVAQRDLSVIVARDIPYRDLRLGILNLQMAELMSVDLVDVYEGEKIPAGKLSLTLRFVFLDREKTLTVDRVQSFSDNVLNFLRNNYGAELRRSV